MSVKYLAHHESNIYTNQKTYFCENSEHIIEGSIKKIVFKNKCTKNNIKFRGEFFNGGNK